MLGPLKYDIWAVASTLVHTNGQQTVTIAWRWRVSCDICNIMAISGCAVCVSMKRLYSYWWSRTSPKCPYAKVLIKPVEKRLHESMTQTKAANCKYNNRAYMYLKYHNQNRGQKHFEIGLRMMSTEKNTNCNRQYCNIVTTYHISMV